jgi:hypothetical protein
MSAQRFEPGSFMTERERSTNLAINQCSLFVCTYNSLDWGLLRLNKTTMYIADINVLTVNGFSQSLGC